MPEIYKTLVTSTGHLQPADLRLFETAAQDPGKDSLLAVSYGYGVRVFLKYEPDDEANPNKDERLTPLGSGAHQYGPVLRLSVVGVRPRR